MKSRKQAQPQYTPRHGAGRDKGKEQKPPEPLLPAKGCQPKQYSCRCLSRKACQAPQPRQEYRSGIGAAQQGRKDVALSPQGNAGQRSGSQKHQIIHCAV